jgi:hypothetical protein
VDDMGEWTTCQQSWLGHTHLVGLMHSLPIFEREWESMLIYCIIGMLRAQWIDSMYATIDQFTHFPMISLEMTELSSGRCLESMSSSESLPVIGTNFLFRYSRSSMTVDL